MKKYIFYIMALSLLLFCGCSASDPVEPSSSLVTESQNEPAICQTELETTECQMNSEKTPSETNPVSDSDENEISSKENDGPAERQPDTATEPKQSSQQSSESSVIPTESSKQENSSQSQLPTEPTEQESKTEPEVPPETEPESEEEIEKSESTPAPETQPETEPDLETEPESSEPEAPAFEVQVWVNFAVSYGQQIGLEYDASAVDCWDNPIIASSQSKYLERDIRSRLNRYLDLGMTGFCVWAEARADGKYDIYIGYR